MSKLVEHARRELELVEKDPWFVEGIMKVVTAFAAMGHSGGSASIAIPTINELLQFHNLSPLTDNPDEWYDNGGLWQNKRRSEAFSLNGGATYYLLSENEGRGLHDLVFHETEHFERKGSDDE